VILLASVLSFQMHVAAALPGAKRMNKTYIAVVERDPQTGLYVGYVPGIPGAHSQGETQDELNANLREVIAMLLEDGEQEPETQFVGLQAISVG
jgi:predicted RNase H-like HicB family nuclease